MSSWIVCDKTIDRILSSEIVRKVWVEHYHDKALKEFGQMLLDMNYEAFNRRYADKEEKGEYVHRFYVANTTDEDMEAHIALRCFLYQCCEGDVPESELYQQMDVACINLSYRILHSLPEYDRLESKCWE